MAKLNIKKIIMLLVTSVLVVAILLIFIFSKKEYYVFKSEVFYDEFETKFGDLKLHRLDEFDIINFFGLGFPSNEDTLFLTDFESNDENYGLFEPKELIIVADEHNNESYYSYFLEFVKMKMANLDDSEMIQMYDKAIVDKNGKVIYMVMSSRQDEIVEFIHNYFK